MNISPYILSPHSASYHTTVQFQQILFVLTCGNYNVNKIYYWGKFHITPLTPPEFKKLFLPLIPNGLVHPNTQLLVVIMNGQNCLDLFPLILFIYAIFSYIHYMQKLPVLPAYDYKSLVYTYKTLVSHWNQSDYQDGGPTHK